MIISECACCGAQYRDSAEVCSVCPHCGHENDYSEAI